MQSFRPSRIFSSLTALVTVAATLVVATPASAAQCSDVEVIFARGTGEIPGLGIVGRPFVESLASALPDLTVTSYAVSYPASFSQNAGPGATDMTNRLTSVAASCPDTVFVLGGYSQGATVTDLALGIRTGISSGSSIPTSLSDRVAAVVVFGNPLGLSGRTIASESALYGARSIDYCNSADSVCGRGTTGSGGHLSYVSNGSASAGAAFAARLVRETDPGTDPTDPAGSCLTASTRDHVAADRAVRVYLVAYARGSADRLGVVSSSNVVSLQQAATGSWELVTAC